MLKSFVLAVLLGLAGSSSAQLLVGPGKELLDPKKAFRIAARALDERSVEVEFRIADGYYMYRDRFSFATEAGERLADVEIPRGTPKMRSARRRPFATWFVSGSPSRRKTRRREEST